MPGGHPDDHGIPEPGEISPEQRAEEAAYIAETVHPDHRASVAGVLSMLRGENPPSRPVQLCECGRPDTPEHRAVWGDHRPWAPPVPVQLCGTPDGTERRADADWGRIHVPEPGFWHRLAERLVAPLARLLGF